MKKTFYLFSVILSLALCSCGDDEKYDFPGDSVNRVYVKSPVNTVNGPDGSLSVRETPVSLDKTSASFSVACTLPASGEIKVTFSVEPSWVENYNQEKGTSYLPMPTEAIEIGNGTLTIPTGSMNSSDEVTISVVDNAISALEAGLYLVALEITEVAGGDAQISSNRSVLYASVNVYRDEDNIYDVTPDASVMGTLLADDRSGWELTALSSSFNGHVPNVFDGNTGSNIGYDYSTLDDNTGFVMDMQKEYTNISGIHYNYYSSWGWVYAVTSADVYTSSDNQEWTYQGHIDSSLGTVPAIFYKPISARYIKTIVRETTSYVYICELNIYVND